MKTVIHEMKKEIGNYSDTLSNILKALDDSTQEQRKIFFKDKDAMLSDLFAMEESSQSITYLARLLIRQIEKDHHL